MKPLYALVVGLLVNYQCSVTSSKSHHSHHHSKDDKEDGKSLSLSPWELHVLSDLYIELNLLVCPSINRLNARAYKRFQAHKVSTAEPTSSSSSDEKMLVNPKFQTTYQDLVRCLEYFDQKHHIPHKKGKSMDAEMVDRTAHEETSQDIKTLVKKLKTDVQNNKEEAVPKSKSNDKPSIFVHSQDKSKPKDSAATASLSSPKSHSFSSSHSKTSSSTSSLAIALPNWVTKTWTWIRKFFWNSNDAKPAAGRTSESRTISKREVEEKDVGKIDENSKKTPIQSLEKQQVKPATENKQKIQIQEKPSTENKPTVQIQEKQQVKPLTEKKTTDKLHKEEQETHKHKTKVARSNVQKILSMMADTVINSCPVKYKPNPSFISQSINEIVKVVSSAPKDLVNAVETYFLEHGLLEQIQSCHRQHSNSKKSVNSVRKTE